MRINGKVKSISPNYPFTVVMENGETFTSHFQFTKGSQIDLVLTTGVFDTPWPKGFVHCMPNRPSSYTLSPEEVNIAHSKVASVLRFPFDVLKAITEGPQHWTVVESFYTYYYTAKFDAVTRTLTTNYAIR